MAVFNWIKYINVPPLNKHQECLIFFCTSFLSSYPTSSFLVLLMPHCQYCTKTDSNPTGTEEVGVRGNSQTTISHGLTNTIRHGTYPHQNPQTPSQFFISSRLGLIMGSTINDLNGGEWALSGLWGEHGRGRGGWDRLHFAILWRLWWEAMSSWHLIQAFGVHFLTEAKKLPCH